MALYLVGRGISFTLPLSGISEIVAKGIASSEKTIDGSKIMKDENRKYDLIVVEVEAGYVEEVMEVARTAGAAAAPSCARVRWAIPKRNSLSAYPCKRNRKYY